MGLSCLDNGNPNTQSYWSACGSLSKPFLGVVIQVAEFALLVISCVQMVHPFVPQTAFMVTTLAVGASSVLFRVGCSYPEPTRINSLIEGDKGISLLIKLSAAIVAILASITLAGHLSLPDLTLSVVILSASCYGARGLWYIYCRGFNQGKKELPDNPDNSGGFGQGGIFVDDGAGNPPMDAGHPPDGGHAHGGVAGEPPP